MTVRDDIAEEIDHIFRSRWETRDGYVVPDPEDIALGANEGVEFKEVVVLYADLDGSTQMVDQKKPKFAAEVYRSFLAAAARVVRSEGGEITAYDGDRIMAVYIGDRKNTAAVRSALKINYVVKKMVTPGLQQYWGSTYEVNHVVGIDRSPMLVARTGIRGGNDLVWVGRAANYAAKLSAIGTGYPTYITGHVFDNMLDEVKYGGNPRRAMWEERVWKPMGDMRIYRSNWWWSI